MTSRHLSLFERCARLPTLLSIPNPPPEPIRDACRRFFDLGLGQIFRGLDVTAPVDFLAAAARGFVYPDNADPYTLAQDYSVWIDGALRLVEEMGFRAWQAGSIVVGPDAYVSLSGGWRTRNALHLFLISDSLDTWPVWMAQLAHPLVEVHLFTLPSTRNGRLISPLTTVYRHPSLNLLRLAPLDGESFSSKWAKIARWEDQTLTWAEWREGISRDRCMDRIVTHHQLDVGVDNSLRRDALAIINSISATAPRLRESCTGCQFHEVCHNDVD